ncbi:Glutathione S-transferase, protein [Cordyceps fumosorosea ARSEF 2679]|uniref:Glutathione S-transferase, protein n=1 Tax=Cordyceps fumosorosea (strain ARSEF 2679) TaxID=1081104 RepID=A0A167PMW3_CORFA|nr:Glutathione S-transferase, protein [Cordyceps fumosorosea ARSEF 2679]OAA56834.1 Glutathione S-transferase, protein [Cordyceps fumosorosea ARSEF 2679]
MSPSPPLKPLVLWGVEHGPNPWKVAFALDELSLPYDHRILDFAATKSPAFTALCVNGRVPALQDPNNADLVLWESGAILEYLLETYDHDRRLSFPPGTQDHFLARQWLHFQVSGQGPYFGQAVWFARHHPERLPTAVERYVGEVRRVTGVIESALADGREYLVGGRYSYADLAFLPWFAVAYFPWYDKAGKGTFADEVKLAEFPHVEAWLARIRARPVTAKSLEDKFATIEKRHKELAQGQT